MQSMFFFKTCTISKRADAIKHPKTQIY